MEYTVVVMRSVCQDHEFKVQADNPHEASEKALEAAYNFDYNNAAGGYHSDYNVQSIIKTDPKDDE